MVKLNGCFLIEDENLLKNSNTIWNKISSDIKKEFDSEVVYNNNFLKTIIKSYGKEARDFHDKEVPNVGFNHTFFPKFLLMNLMKNKLQ